MPTSPFDLAAIIEKLRQSGFGDIPSPSGAGQPNSSTYSQSYSLRAPGASGPPPQLPGVDVFGRLIGASGQPLGQPSGEDRLVTLSNGAGFKPPDTVIGENGLIQNNPMATAFKARKAAGEEAQQQARSDETDAMIEEMGQAKARKDGYWDQEVAARSAQSAANFEADMQARGAQRTTQKRGGSSRIGRSAQGRPGPR